MKLITRREAQEILKIKEASSFFWLIRDSIKVKKQEIRNGRNFNLYDLSEIEGLAKKLQDKSFIST